MSRFIEDVEMLDTLGVSSRDNSVQRPFNGALPNGVRPLSRNAMPERKSSGRNTRETSVLSMAMTNRLNLDASESSDDELNTPRKAEDFHNTRPASAGRTGLCYDARMRFHCETDPPKDRSDYHPEDPRRIFHIYRELCEAGLVDDEKMAIGLKSNPLYRIDARLALKAELRLVHEDAHIAFMETTRDMSNQVLQEREKLLDSIYLGKLTYLCALLSAGGAIDTCLAVTNGTVKNAIAVIRPPGHHAECDRPMGFCIFDNVSIAAKVCQQKYPDTCRKILILDWDVHHGNGIQQTFESDPNVLYISLHVHENGKFYPPGPAGNHVHCGLGAGLGKNINIPWPSKGMGDADYLFAFQNIVMPVAYDFDPDLVIIAAGFDAAAGDQLGGCFVTPPCYAHMTHMLMSLADGKVVVCLEGGYNLKSISKSALAVTQTLMGEPLDRISNITPTKKGIATVKKVIAHQSKFWRCLYSKGYTQEIRVTHGAERLHDVIRAYQSKCLSENHKMIQLHVLRSRLSKSYDNQVLASENYASSVPLLVIFHDPPEVYGNPNPSTNKLDLHNSWLADALKDYIAWAVKQRFGVIDVNIPKFLTTIHDEFEEEEDDEDEEKLPDRKHIEMQELAVYLWENYIECNDSSKVFFIGVGEAYHAVLHLLNTRNDVAIRRFGGVVHFLADQSIKKVSETFVAGLTKWYFNNSLIFVENDHIAWEPDSKHSKKFGKLIKSPVCGLNAMLLQHQKETEKFLLLRADLPKDREREREREREPDRMDDGDTIMVGSRV